MDTKTELERVKQEVSQMDHRVHRLEKRMQWVEAVARAKGWIVDDPDSPAVARPS